MCFAVIGAAVQFNCLDAKATDRFQFIVQAKTKRIAVSNRDALVQLCLVKLDLLLTIGSIGSCGFVSLALLFRGRSAGRPITDCVGRRVLVVDRRFGCGDVFDARKSVLGRTRRASSRWQRVRVRLRSDRRGGIQRAYRIFQCSRLFGRRFASWSLRRRRLHQRSRGAALWSRWFCNRNRWRQRSCVGYSDTGSVGQRLQWCFGSGHLCNR